MTTRIRERMTLEMRVETFNTFNHFNPSNPNTSLTLNPASGANTNAAFGTIQSAQCRPATWLFRHGFGSEPSPGV